MGISNKEIGWSQEAILLHGVSKQLERLSKIISQISDNIGTITINGVEQDLTSDKEWLTLMANTGILDYGTGVSFNNTTTIDISPMSGYIVDNETNPLIPTHIFVDYPGATGVTVTTLGTGTGSYVMLDSSSNIVFQNTFPSSTERKQKILIGKIGHPLGLITSVISVADFITSPLSQLTDLFQAIMFINGGVYPYYNGANLKINVTFGYIHGSGINLHNDPTNPNKILMGPQTPISFVYRTQLGVGGTTITDVDPDSFDNGGVISAVTGATVQWIFCVPGAGFIIQYGQYDYSTLQDAIDNIGKEQFVVFPNLEENAILIGVLALEAGATDLSDNNQAQFFRADKFGQIIKASTGVTGANMQTVFDSSTVPQITVSDATGPFTLKNNRAADTSTIQEWFNLANVLKAFVTGEGNFVGTKYIASGKTINDILLGNGDTTPTSTFLTASSTNTLTNKAITKRVVTVAYAASLAPNIDTTDIFRVNPVTGNLAFTAPTGTKVDGQMLLIHLLSDASIRTLTFPTAGAGEYIGTTEFNLPTATISSKWIKILFMYNVTLDRWECISVVNSL